MPRELPPGYTEAPKKGRELPPGYTEAPAAPSESLLDRLTKAYTRGFGGEEQFAGLTSPENIAEELGQETGPIVGGVVGSLGGPWSAALGAASGKAAQQAYQATQGRDVGVGGAISGPAVEAAKQYAGEKVIGYAAPFAKKAVVGTTDYLAKNLGGISRATVETLKEFPSEVGKRIGIEGPNYGQLADSIRGIIDTAVTKGEQTYAAIARELSGPNPKFGRPISLDFGGAIKKRMDDVARDFGYNAPSGVVPVAPKPSGLLDQFGRQIPAPPAPPPPLEDGVERVVGTRDVALFNKFRELAGKLRQASPQQVYFFQRDLNNAILENEGRPIAAALAQVKDSVNKFISDSADQLPDLVKANEAYRTAKELEQTTRRLVSADDMVSFIKNAYAKADSQTRDMLERVAGSIPEVGQAIRGVKVELAAQEASPFLRKLPQTGFGAAMVAGGGAAAMAFPKLLGLGALASPRAYSMAYRAGPGLGRAIGAASPAAAIPGVDLTMRAGQSLADYYNRRRMESR